MSVSRITVIVMAQLTSLTVGSGFIHAGSLVHDRRLASFRRIKNEDTSNNSQTESNLSALNQYIRYLVPGRAVSIMR